MAKWQAADDPALPPSELEVASVPRVLMGWLYRPSDMAVDDLKKPVERRLIETSTGTLEVFIGGPIAPGIQIVCAAHPAGVLAESAVNLLRETASTTAVCINPRGIGASAAAPSGNRSYTLESMVDDLDSIRRHLGVEAWEFWGVGWAWRMRASTPMHSEA